MKKRIMVVGPSGAGKSTLCNIINNAARLLKKTQDVIYGPHTIDTPGAYLENAWMYKYLIATAQGAALLLILVDQANPREVYPPGFAKTFTCPVVGVVTKADLAPENRELCRQQLKRIGVAEPYFYLSLTDGTGVAELLSYLENKKVLKGRETM
ncbi:EutP/PduV family microcompartment system protein [Desulforamulus ferrireducens]|uniref:Ethanolamine utilization protein EutP n=1 Tax=Desulforamulus ferrireducens TaxID=1833852 RepID=A0A1S6ISF1_9FIRM|nr:EutP/PduV family microcompartment system protein [Desulforamulus ferrireducens]AQS57701.1 ethanolamine utilization protein EutP [Desulforamulus ferrireducens]